MATIVQIQCIDGDNVTYYDIDLDYVTDKQLNAIAGLMDDELREAIHKDLAPCSNAEFIQEFLKRDFAQASLILSGFSIHAPEYEIKFNV